MSDDRDSRRWYTRNESLPEVLAPEERRRISSRLGAGLLGIGLLALGTLLMRLRPTSGRSERFAGHWRRPSWESRRWSRVCRGWSRETRDERPINWWRSPYWPPRRAAIS